MGNVIGRHGLQLAMLLTPFILLSLQSCKGQATKPAQKISDFKFESIFGTTAKEPNSTYCLLGSGFLRTPQSDNADSVINDWIKKHPNGNVVSVSSFGPILADSKDSKMVYCWLIDNKDTLNIELVKKGCFPGGTMMKQKTWSEMEKWEKDMYEKNEKPDIKVYVDTKSYDNFIEQIKTAELYASERKLGIWEKEAEE